MLQLPQPVHPSVHHPPPGIVYPAARGLLSAALPCILRRVRVEGRAWVPPSGPLLVVANHHNGAVDPALIALHLGRPLRLTAKSTLARLPILASLFRVFGVICLHRERDRAEGARPEANGDALAAMVEALAAGDALVIFPEGTSHDDPGLRRFKHGASHVALAAVERLPRGPVWVLPCALRYQGKGRLRGRASLSFGPAIDAADWRRVHAKASPGRLTRLLQERVAEQLAAADANSEAAAPLPPPAARRHPFFALLVGLPALLALAPSLVISRLLSRRCSPDRHSDPSWQLFLLAASLPFGALTTALLVHWLFGWVAAVLLLLSLPWTWPSLWQAADAFQERLARLGPQSLRTLPRPLARRWRSLRLALDLDRLPQR